MNSAPEDILIKIFDYLNPESLKSISKVNFRFNTIIANSITLMDKLELIINPQNIDEAAKELENLPYKIISIRYEAVDEPDLKKYRSDFSDRDRKCPYEMELTDEEFEKLKEFEEKVLEVIKKDQIERIKIEFFTNDFLHLMTDGMKNLKSLHMKKFSRVKCFESKKLEKMRKMGSFDQEKEDKEQEYESFEEIRLKDVQKVESEKNQGENHQELGSSEINQPKKAHQVINFDTENSLKFPNLIHITTEMATSCLDLIDTDCNKILSFKFIEDVQQHMEVSRVAQKSSELTNFLKKLQNLKFLSIQGFIPFINLDFLPITTLKVVFKTFATNSTVFHYDDQYLNLLNISKSTLKDLKLLSSPFGFWKEIFDMNLKLEKLRCGDLILPVGYEFPKNENLTEMHLDISCDDFKTVKNFFSAHPNVQRLSLRPSFLKNSFHYTEFFEHLPTAMPKLKHFTMNFLPHETIIHSGIEIPSVESFTLNRVLDMDDLSEWMSKAALFPNLKRLKVDQWGWFDKNDKNFKRKWGIRGTYTDYEYYVNAKGSKIPCMDTQQLSQILHFGKKIEEIHIGRKFYIDLDLIEVMKKSLKKFVLHVDDEQMNTTRFKECLEEIKKFENLQVVILKSDRDHCDCNEWGVFEPELFDEGELKRLRKFM